MYTFASFPLTRLHKEASQSSGPFSCVPLDCSDSNKARRPSLSSACRRAHDEDEDKDAEDAEDVDEDELRKEAKTACCKRASLFEEEEEDDSLHEEFRHIAIFLGFGFQRYAVP